MTLPSLASCEVLLVDDNVDARDAVAHIIKVRTGVKRVVCADDGQEALDKLRDGVQPCVILLDLQTPRLDGFGFRNAQLADATLRDIPVILYSAADDLARIAARMGLGPDQFLQKPIDFDELCDRVRRFCKPLP